MSEKRELAGWSTGPSRAVVLRSALPSSRPASRSAPKPSRLPRAKPLQAAPPTPENTASARVRRKEQFLVIVTGFAERCAFCILDGVGPFFSPSFRPRSSTSVLLRVEPILYPESYCSLGPTQIHFSFDQEDFFDWFRTPHYPALFHAPAAHCSLDHGGGGW